MEQHLILDILPDEVWWGGIVNDGVRMPFSSGYEVKRDLRGHLSYNQGAPLLLSNKGRYIWSEEPLSFEIAGGELRVNGMKELIQAGRGGENLREAFLYASSTFFPPSGTSPDRRFFTVPQYNTWMEMSYECSQQKVIDYAEAILANGLPPGLLMIDDNWHEYYGKLSFDRERFPDPKKMVEHLHKLGFTVMLWVCPFISPDSPVYRYLNKRGCLVRDSKGRPAIREWWNGFSAVLDLTNPEADEWIREQFDKLMHSYHIDGFKLDAGDPEYYALDDITYKPTTPNEQSEIWGRLGLHYRYNEYRACWKMGGQPLVQRLSDKNHSWSFDGLGSLIPNGLAQGLLGFAFNCPDMVGGGQYEDLVRPDFKVDQELFVRYAQCAALFPMIQFSTAPWRVLDQEHAALCIQAAQLHVQMGQYIEELAIQAGMTGEPIMRHLAYMYPDMGYEKVTDQFLLGEHMLVAPVLQQGAVHRTVVFPPGEWVDEYGSVVMGPCEREVEAPLDRLPWYQKRDTTR